ncbi:MAG TPA: response regulator [Rhodothermales bacterium]|nr:response regulator [Rhodothermales bacterium]
MLHIPFPVQVTFTGLPIGQPEGPATEASPEVSSVAEATGPLVLVVDDEEEVCLYLRMCLKPLTRRVLEAADGREALSLLQTTPGIRLVISDVVMPHMDGIALKAAIRVDPVLRAIPVLLISGEVTHPRDGPVLRKPFNARALRDAVKALLADTP